MTPTTTLNCRRESSTATKAKYHLNKAGLANAKLELHVGDAAFTSVEVGMLLQSEAARIGLTIDLKREPSDGYWSNVWRQRSFHAGEWNARPTDDLLLSVGYTSNAKWNESGYKNERLDKLVEEARGTLDFQKRKAIYWEVQKILYEDGCSAIPAFTNYIGAASTKVKGLTHCKTGRVRRFQLRRHDLAGCGWLKRIQWPQPRQPTPTAWRRKVTRLVIKRLAISIVTMWAVTVMVFVGTEILPGDVAQAILGQSATPETLAGLRSQLGLDRPAYVRYLSWLGGFTRGDLGTSLSGGTPISGLIKQRLGNTLLLARDHRFRRGPAGAAHRFARSDVPRQRL